mgnify:CR=1 FL=1
MSKTQHAGEDKLLNCKIVSSRGVVADIGTKVIGIQIYGTGKQSECSK